TCPECGYRRGPDAPTAHACAPSPVPNRADPPLPGELPELRDSRCSAHTACIHLPARRLLSPEHKESRMKAKWLILSLAGLVLVAAWATVVVTYFFHPSIAVWTGIVTVAAFCTEGFLWVCAGVLGFSFLAKRRQMLSNL